MKAVNLEKSLIGRSLKPEAHLFEKLQVPFFDAAPLAVARLNSFVTDVAWNVQVHSQRRFWNARIVLPDRNSGSIPRAKTTVSWMDSML